MLVAAASAIVVLGRGSAEPYILVFLAVLATVGVFSLFALACGILRLPTADSGSPLIKALVDDAVRRRCRHRSRRPRHLRQCRLSRPDRRLGRAATCARSSACSSATPTRPKRSTGCSRRRAKASASQEEVRVAGMQWPAGALAAAAGPAARRGPAREPPHGLVAHRRYPRARAAGECLSGIAARDRLSRSRAGRIFLRRCQGRRRLSQRHARQLARPGSRPGRLRRSEARPTSSPATARRC